MSFFSQINNFLPAQPVNPWQGDEYTGTEYSYWRFVFRPANYKIEVYLLSFYLCYIAWWRIGRSINRSIAKTWVKSIASTLTDNFTLLEPKVDGKEFPVLADGSQLYLSYASGRKNTYSLHSTIELIPRHDPLTLLYETVKPLWDFSSSLPNDTVTYDCVIRPQMPEAGTGVGVFALLRKEGLQAKRTGRWDLSFPILPTVNVADLPPAFALLSEHPNVNLVILSNPSIQKLLASSSFESLVISDLPAVKPTRAPEAGKAYPCRVTVSYRPKKDAQENVIFLESVLELVDDFSSVRGLPGLGPEVKKRVKENRREAWEDIEMARKKSEALAKGETGEKEEAEKKQREKRREKLEAMTPEEKRRQEELKRKRGMKKSARIAGTK